LVPTSTHGLCQTINGILSYYTFFYTDFSLFFKVGAKRQPFETVFAVLAAFSAGRQLFRRPAKLLPADGSRKFRRSSLSLQVRHTALSS
jgi:hypothetical protein